MLPVFEKCEDGHGLVLIVVHFHENICDHFNYQDVQCCKYSEKQQLGVALPPLI